MKFLANWKIRTSDRAILDIVKGWEVPLTGPPSQICLVQAVKMDRLEERAMDQEIESMLAKGAIREAIPKSDQFLSNVFVTPKGEGEFRPIIISKFIHHSYCSIFNCRGLS